MRQLMAQVIEAGVPIVAEQFDLDQTQLAIAVSQQLGISAKCNARDIANLYVTKLKGMLNMTLDGWEG
jgi:hypothetical protein